MQADIGLLPTMQVTSEERCGDHCRSASAKKKKEKNKTCLKEKAVRRSTSFSSPPGRPGQPHVIAIQRFVRSAYFRAESRQFVGIKRVQPGSLGRTMVFARVEVATA